LKISTCQPLAKRTPATSKLLNNAKGNSALGGAFAWPLKKRPARPRTAHPATRCSLQDDLPISRYDPTTDAWAASETDDGSDLPGESHESPPNESTPPPVTPKHRTPTTPPPGEEEYEVCALPGFGFSSELSDPFVHTPSAANAPLSPPPPTPQTPHQNSPRHPMTSDPPRAM